MSAVTAAGDKGKPIWVPFTVTTIKEEMLKHTKHLDISKILQVAESLENTICCCFGPEGRQVLFIKSTGELIITKDGKRILDYLLLDHPVARMIVNSASKHYSVTGDGVKSFVLLLCAFLREIQSTVNKNEDMISSGKAAVFYNNKYHVLRRISNMLLSFQSTVLEPIIKTCLGPSLLSMYTNMDGKVTLCRASLQQTLDTYFCGINSCNNQGFISRLVCDYLYECSHCADDILEVVSFVERCFAELHTQVPGFPVDNSRVLPGLVLHRDFSVYCPVEGDLQALIVTDQIHQSLSAPAIGFVVSSDIQLHLSQLQQRTENIMKQLQKNQIKLILSVVKQHEMVTFNAKLHGISIVECIASEEIDLLCAVTGATPLSTPFTEHLQNNSFLLKTCHPVLLGDKKYVQLVFSASLAFKPHSIVLYGPVRGLTEQIASSFHGAFKMLKQLFQPVDASWEQALNNSDFCLPNRRVPLEEQRVTCSNCQNDSDCCGCHLQGMDQYTSMHSTHNIPGDISECKPIDSLRLCSQKCTSTHNMSLQYLEQSLQQASEAEPAPRLSSSINLKSTKLPADVPSHKQGISTNPFTSIGLVLPSGGVFEILLHHHLNNFSKNCPEPELANVCTMFGEALLCIPRHICQAKMGRACFPLVYKQCIDVFKNKEPIDITQTGLESVSCKYQLMVSVLQCISKLMSIDLIIGVKGPQSVNKRGENL